MQYGYAKKNKSQLQTFSNEPIHIELNFRTPVTSDDWLIAVAIFTIVVDDLKQLIDCSLLDTL